MANQEQKILSDKSRLAVFFLISLILLLVPWQFLSLPSYIPILMYVAAHLFVLTAYVRSYNMALVKSIPGVLFLVFPLGVFAPGTILYVLNEIGSFKLLLAFLITAPAEFLFYGAVYFLNTLLPLSLVAFFMFFVQVFFTTGAQVNEIANDKN